MSRIVGLVIATVVVVIAIAEVVGNVHSGAMAAFINSVVILAAMVGVVVLYAPLRPVGTRTTWGEAMVGATFAFLGMAVAYGSVPDQWIDLAAYWGWDDPGRLLSDPDLTIEPIATIVNVLPFNVAFFHLRDIIVVGIYGVMLGLNVWIWLFWQGRGKVKTEVEPVSGFGRPLVKEA